MALLNGYCLRALRSIAIAAVALSLSAFAARSPSESFNEYQIKAVFLFNFAQFVEWMPRTPAVESAPFAICVLGDDPFKGFLDETVRGETIGSRHFEVKRSRTAQDAGDCQILFVSSSVARQLPTIIDTFKNRPVLTVSDLSDFASSGGMVQFVTENNRIRLVINVDAARAANLTISSKLLRPATIVSSKGG